ncbi:MAG: aminotransferase class V-fold PLP-dependent enzyme [Acidaminococcaceae bacterium]|nr:aminotransferase class V-fold PLP-dependent enzyme [Acidaminococcaceae bacterium]
MKKMMSELKPYNEQEEKISREYHLLANDIIASKTQFLGYPVNEKNGLEGFYKWYLESGLINSMLINAGNPFQPAHFSLHTFEIEKKVIRYFSELFQFPKNGSWGMIGMGGTDGNNHGVYFGKKMLRGITGKLPVVYVSSEAHYSNMRLADLQGLQVKLIPADIEGKMDVAAFAKALEPDKPALIIYAMGTTFKGAMDDISALNKVLQDRGVQNVYRHVDAALFGGYLPFTRRKDLVSQKLLQYDSIALSGHKFFGIDEPCCVFLCRKEVFDAQKNDKIPYLESDMPMISCSRSALTPLKLYWLLQTKGWYAYARQAVICIKNAKFLHQELLKMQWPAWRNEASNTVYFKQPCRAIIEKYSLACDRDDRLCGDLAHIVVMQHVKQPLLERFLKDLKKWKH